MPAVGGIRAEQQHQYFLTVFLLRHRRHHGAGPFVFACHGRRRTRIQVAVSDKLPQPASYSAVNRQTALFQVGLYGQNYYLRSQDTKSSYNTFNVSEIALQLPIAEGLGFTVGISPFSSVGYRITQSEEGSDVWEEIGYVHYLYSGSGRINSYGRVWAMRLPTGILPRSGNDILSG